MEKEDIKGEIKSILDIMQDVRKKMDELYNCPFSDLEEKYVELDSELKVLEMQVTGFNNEMKTSVLNKEEE